MSEHDAQRMLGQVRAAAAAMESARGRRDAAIREAMQAGVPRMKIAAAAGLDRTRLYGIARDTP